MRNHRAGRRALLVLGVEGVSMTRWLSIAALALGLSPAAAEPLVKRNVVHYDVSGASAQEIRAEMDRLGPRRVDQAAVRRDDALECEVDLPLSQLRPGLRDRARLGHRRRHHHHAAPQAGLRPVGLARTFRNSPTSCGSTRRVTPRTASRSANGSSAAIAPHPTCDALSRAANALGDRLIKEANQMDVEYDARTQHGRTQGARFPAGP